MFLRELPNPIKLYNIDGTQNSAGSITHTVRLLTRVEGMKPQLLEFMITNLGSEEVILGLLWLKQTKPKVDWKLGTLEPPEKETNELLY